MSLTLAIMIHATAVVIDFSKSLASRRLRLIQARVRSTTQRRGSNTKPLAMSNSSTMLIVQLPSGTSDARAFRRIAAIGEDVAQPREGASDRAQKRGCAVAILDIRRMDDRADQQSAGVGEDVSLAALDLLAGVEAARTTRLGGFDRLAIDHPGRRARLAPATSRACINR